MRKSKYAALFILILCMTFTGCSKDAAKSDNGPKSSLSSKKDKDEKADESGQENADKKNKKTKKNRVPVSGKVEKEEDIDYEKIYAPVLDEARDMITNGYDHDRDYDFPSNGLMERVMYPGDDDLSEVIGYYYKDLNGDDIPELLIGENAANEYDNPNDIAYIYSGYSCKDGKPVCFVEGWARNRQNYLGDGQFFNMGSGGAMNTCFGEWHLSEDGTEQVWDDFYFSQEDAQKRAAVFFHNTTGREEVDESEKLDITEEEFWDLIDIRGFKCGAIAWTPLGPKKNGGRYIVNTMTDDELLGIEKKLDSIRYYGFLLSYYTDPRDIDWNEVFYVGAGLDDTNGNPSAEIEKAYLKATGEDEVYTDLTTVSGKDVKKFVRETTGYDYSEMNHPLDWVYLKKYDLYASEHGDTNQMSFAINGGQVENGEITVTYDGRNDVECCLTFKDEGGRLKFISNQPRWMVEDPTNGGDVDQSAITDGMIFPDSDLRRLTEADLDGLDAQELRFARNEIYARHGRKFKAEDLKNHFESMDWYFPSVDAMDFDEHVLNDYEIYNLDFIGKYEKNINR